MILFSIVILFVCLFIGTPVPVSFMAVALYGLIVGDHDPSFLIPYGASKLGAVILFSIPLFIIAGGIIERGSIGSKIVDSVQKPFARIKGGLGVILVVSCAVFGSITGSACATLSCIGSIMFPKMEKAGLSKAHTATLLANAAPLGMLIPPSGIVILYSWLSGQSVLAGFLSTVVPGIILTILFALINVYLVKDDPNVTIELPSSNPILLKEKKRCSSALPALFLPVIILGGIYGGVITTVEAASVSVVYAIVVGYFYYKELTWNAIKESLVDGATVTGVVMIMVFGINMLSRIYIMEDLPTKILDILKMVSENKYMILLMLNIFMVVMGMLMDDTSACMLCTPILVPIIKEIGVSPIQFAAILSVNLGMGNVTPPCAPLLYLAGSLGGAQINKMIKPCMYYIFLGWIPVLILTTYIPDISLFLPRLILGIK